MTYNPTRRLFSRSAVAALSALVVIFAVDARAVTIDTVPVGNPGNAGELSGAGAGGYGADAIVGAVDYNYEIGTTEVTNPQYAEFLNAKAKSNPLNLYSSSMGSDAHGGITQSGVSGSFTYAVKPNFENKPVNFVNWYASIRFANWLHNGQGNGSTESGAYTLMGGTVTPTNAASIVRNAGAIWFMPSEDEWYKAAYYDPRTAAEGGPPGDDQYWSYPTRSDIAPTFALATSSGGVSNPGANVANYWGRADWNGQDGNVTTVGGAGPLSTSYYGTFDQGGNVWEPNEEYFSSEGGVRRGIRGGGWFSGAGLNSNYRFDTYPAGQSGGDHGFRVATIVPEPSTFVLVIVGCAMIWWWRKRRK